MNVVQTRSLTKNYGAKRAVDNLDMSVSAGEIYGFVGKNGAGKSTVMKMIAGLVSPTSGEIELLGERRGVADGGHASHSSPSCFSRVGALIEDPGILPTFSAFENLMCKAIAVGVVRPESHCRELLELVGLDDTGSLRVMELLHFTGQFSEGLGNDEKGGPSWRTPSIPGTSTRRSSARSFSSTTTERR